MANTQISTLARELLGDKLDKIHAGYYPKSEIKKMAEHGLFDGLDEQESEQNASSGLKEMILKMSEVGKVCGNTAFCVWCQDAFLWYLYNSSNLWLKKELFAAAKRGEIFGATALSNPMKAFADIEKNSVDSKKVDGGYVLNGTLPWVSNIESNHYFGVVFKIEGATHHGFGVVKCDENVKLKDSIKYCALDGSATKSVILKDYFLKDDFVLSDVAESYLLKIVPGFVLLQGGIALGIINSALEEIEKSSKTHGHINIYLNIDELYVRRDALLQSVVKLLDTPYNNDPSYLKTMLEARLEASNLVLESSKMAMLCAGTRGYFKDSKVSKILLESYFVAIVTPSIKHILKEFDDVSKGKGVAKIFKSYL